MCKPAVHKLQKSSIPIQVDTGHKEYHCAGHDGGPLAPRPRSLKASCHGITINSRSLGDHLAGRRLSQVVKQQLAVCIEDAPGGRLVGVLILLCQKLMATQLRG